MKIVFMGTPRFSVKILESVHEKYGVDLVVTQPDKLVDWCAKYDFKIFAKQ